MRTLPRQTPRNFERSPGITGSPTPSTHPHIDAVSGDLNDRLRKATVAATQEAVGLAAAVDAGSVAVHGGTARKRFRASVRDPVRERSVRTVPRVDGLVRTPIHTRQTPRISLAGVGRPRVVLVAGSNTGAATRSGRGLPTPVTPFRSAVPVIRGPSVT
jgi:hypothetical protein